MKSDRLSHASTTVPIWALSARFLCHGFAPTDRPDLHHTSPGDDRWTGRNTHKPACSPSTLRWTERVLGPAVPPPHSSSSSPLPLPPSLLLPDSSRHFEKFRAVTGNVKQLRRAFRPTRTHLTMPHTRSWRGFSQSVLFYFHEAQGCLTHKCCPF